MKNLHETLTNAILERIENASGKWDKGFLTIPDPPRNLTGRLYTGVNSLALYNPDYQNQIYATFDQINNLGGSIRKGEKSQIVVFWKKSILTEKDPATGDDINKSVALMKYFNVFNIDQTTLKPEQATSPALLEAQTIIENMQNKPFIKVDKSIQFAYYYITNDVLVIPTPEQFSNESLFYSTFFHELGHATGHASRLNRTMKSYKDDGQAYAKEELIAELTASFLCSRTGHTSEIQENNNALYLKHWVEQMKKDPRYIFNVCSQAQQATNYILNQD